MRSILLLATLLLIGGELTTLHAQRNDWKPIDIRPLTKLPWLGAELRPLDVILNEIFHEPNMHIRYPVLGNYLETIPTAQLGEAYDKCIILEGTQTPDQLVEFLLRIWARRDPHACWERTKKLFDLVGIEQGFLGYDSYVDRYKITVQNRDAIRASRYWIEERAALLGFVTGLQQSSLPEEEQVRLMKECADIWFARFKCWPNEDLSEYYEEGRPDSKELLAAVMRPFELSLDELRQYPLYGRTDTNLEEEEAIAEIVLRRWLIHEPQAAVEIVKKTQARAADIAATKKAGGEVYYRRDFMSGPLPSRSWLHLWHTLDPEGMLQWARQSSIISDPAVLAARGMLLSRVDASTRDKWLKDAADVEESGNVFHELLGEWSIWDFKSAMNAALKTGEAYHATSIQNHATSGFVPLNLRHANLGQVRDFDVNILRQRSEDGYLYDWATESMECWGRIDVGEAARYGVAGLMKLHHFPQSDLIKFFKGESNDFSDTGDMIDRTFCCLRVWAVVRPDEMKAWIPTIQDSAMRDALTWLLENPWGTGENAEQ